MKEWPWAAMHGRPVHHIHVSLIMCCGSWILSWEWSWTMAHNCRLFKHPSVLGFQRPDLCPGFIPEALFALLSNLGFNCKDSFMKAWPATLVSNLEAADMHEFWKGAQREIPKLQPLLTETTHRFLGSSIRMTRYHLSTSASLAGHKHTYHLLLL